MTSPHQAARTHLLAALYGSKLRQARTGGPGEYATWLETSMAVRGPLERKRVASQGDLVKRIGASLFDVDASYFTFVVESYLEYRAQLLVRMASFQMADGGNKSSQLGLHELLSSDAVRDIGLQDWPELGSNAWVIDVLQSMPTGVVEAELQSAQKSIEGVLANGFGDVLGADHQLLIPRQLRHAVGAFYTPAWLADYVFRSACPPERTVSDLRILDPTCGSGAFLLAAAEQTRRHVAEGRVSPDVALKTIRENILGMDIDESAVIQASANLILGSIAMARRYGISKLDGMPTVIRQDSLESASWSPTVDVVVGNPPWVNWEYLPPAYRNRHAPLWQDLAVFDLKGRDRAFSKEDVSALFVANSIDKYLSDGGRLGFVVPQSLFKASLNHRGFRRFALRRGFQEVDVRVERVEDFVAVKPFEGVANRTVVVLLERGSRTTFPVPYKRWLKIAPETKSGTGTFKGEAVDEVAEPSDAADPSSHWTTGTIQALEAVRALAGTTAYVARTGAFTGGANGVYHLEPLSTDDTEAGTIRVRNIIERAKRVVPQVEAELEPNYIYPFLRGRDVSQWTYESSVFLLVPHTAESKMRPVAEDVLQAEAPHTLNYLSQFRAQLAERRGFVGWERQNLEHGYYAIQRIGEYTFAPWKVVWRYISPNFTTCVIGPAAGGPLSGKPIIPNEKLMMIACDSKREAYFVGGILASAPVISFVESRMISTQIAPQVIRGLNLPKFDEQSGSHTRIANLCEVGHALQTTDVTGLNDLLDELDGAVSRLLDVPERGAKELRAAFCDSRR